MLGGRQRMRNVPESGWRTRRMPEQPPRLLRHPLVHVLRDLLMAPGRSRTNSCQGPAGRSRSCHYLGEHLLGGELVPVGAARVLADGGDQLAELVVASDPELNPAGAAADVPG